MDIYENIVIGNFLFDLGRCMNNQTDPICVNLLQQTPLDTRLGDVLVENARFTRLIEFKRAVNDKPKEKSKLRCLQAALVGHKGLERISRKIHWYVESQVVPMSDKFHHHVRVVPYLDFELDGKWVQLHDLVIDTANAAYHSVFTEHERRDCKAYLHLLWKSQGSDAALSGALIICATDRGEIQHIVGRSIRDIGRTLREVVKRAQERDLAVQRLEKQLSRDLQLSRERGL